MRRLREVIDDIVSGNSGEIPFGDDPFAKLEFEPSRNDDDDES